MRTHKWPSLPMAKMAIILTLLPLKANTAEFADDMTVVGSATLASDYVFRGLSQNSENPVVQMGLGLQHRRGYYANVWASTLDTHELAPDFGSDSGYEVNVTLGVGKPIADDWAWELNVSHYKTFETDQILDYDATEMVAAVIFQQWLRTTVAYAFRATDHAAITNAKKRGPRRALEIAAQWPVSRLFSVNGGIGYADLSNVSGVKHAYWNAGIGFQVDRYQANLGIFGTDSDARDRYIDGRADSRVVFSIVARLGGN